MKRLKGSLLYILAQTSSMKPAGGGDHPNICRGFVQMGGEPKIRVVLCQVSEAAGAAGKWGAKQCGKERANSY